MTVVGSSSSFDFDFGSSSSSYDYDYDFSGSSGSGGIPIGVIVTIVVIAIAIYNSKKGGNIPMGGMNISRNTEVPQTDIEAEIKKIDPAFSEEKFLSWTKTVFVSLQEAWTKRDWSIIRPFESNELFEQHSRQLQEYIDNNKINVMERIAVNYANLYKFEQEGDKDNITINLKATMKDYIIDATTKEVLEGDKTTDRITLYRLTFARKTGVKTQEGEAKLKTSNCPNCGAPLKVTMAGKCEYCSSIITTGEHDWVLVNLQAVK